MLHLLFLIVIGAVSLQTDWMGGSGVLGPASDWRTQYYKGDSVTAATPGQVSLVATEWDYSKWEKHIVESNWGIGSNHQGFMPADINKDGKKDLVAHTADKVVWYENLGDYTFATKHIIGPANDGFSVYLSVYPCDLDTDGDIDVLVATKGVGLGWYENQGSLWIWHIVDNGIGYHRVSSADVELDGDVDMIAVDNSSSQSHGDVYLFRNDGAQNFAKELIGNLFDDGWRVYPADFNGDGFPDIYSIGFNSNYVFLNDRTGHFTLSWSSNYWVDGDFDGAWAEDIDMDGDIDLVCGKQWDSGVKGFYALLNDGTGYNFDSTLLAEVSSGHYMDGAIAADIDLDGLPDIAGTYDEIGWFRQDPANPLTFSVYDVDTAAMSHNSHWVYVASLRCWECVPSMDILVTETKEPQESNNNRSIEGNNKENTEKVTTQTNNQSSVENISYEKEQALLEELASDEYGYDLRNWKEQGITEDEIRKRYESCDRENDYPIVSASRYFTFVFPKLKTDFNTPVEKIIEVIMQTREKNWQNLKGHTLEGTKTGLKWYIQNKEIKDERTSGYTKRSYEAYVKYCKVLNEPSVSKQSLFDLPLFKIFSPYIIFFIVPNFF